MSWATIPFIRPNGVFRKLILKPGREGRNRWPMIVSRWPTVNQPAFYMSANGHPPTLDTYRMIKIPVKKQVIILSKYALQIRKWKSILCLSNRFRNLFIIQLISFMKNTRELNVHPPGNMFLKLTILGCFLMGSVYGFLLLFNTAIKAFP